MDPLSITAGALAILSAATATVRSAKRFREAPGEMEALLNDLAEVQVNVKCLEDDMQPLIAKGELAEEYETSLMAELVSANGLVHALADCVTSDHNRNSKLGSVSNRFRWARSRGKVKSLRAKLEQLRRSLEMHLGIVHR